MVKSDLRAAVIFYGDHPPVDEIARIQAPLLGMYGGDDHRLADPAPAFAQAMQEAGKSFEYHIYPGAPHAFVARRPVRPLGPPEPVGDLVAAHAGAGSTSSRATTTFVGKPTANTFI